jgi:hypothetical protein
MPSRNVNSLSFVKLKFQLAITPQFGFASTAEEPWAKLKLAVDGRAAKAAGALAARAMRFDH